jgi:hypothetical protein
MRGSITTGAMRSSGGDGAPTLSRSRVVLLEEGAEIIRKATNLPTIPGPLANTKGTNQ